MPPDSCNASRRWFRFSVRAVLVAVALIAIALAIVANPMLRQRRAVAELAKSKIWVTYGKPTGTFGLAAFLDKHLGEGWTRPVIIVELSHGEVSDEMLAVLDAFPLLEEIQIDAYEAWYLARPKPPKLVTDKGLTRFLEHHPNLQNFAIWSCPEVTDEGLAHLAEMKKLKSAYFGYGLGSPALRGTLRSEGVRVGDITVAY
jgi:hypothetical protein